MSSSSDATKQIDELISGTQFLSPNEPITVETVKRVLSQIGDAVSLIDDAGSTNIDIWNANTSYDIGDVVVYTKQETEQVDVNVGLRTFVFILMSTKDGNTSVPNWQMVDGLPDFSDSNWYLVNPLSYLLQDMIGLKELVKEVYLELLKEHLDTHHSLIGSASIEDNLVKNDYSNLVTEMQVGVPAVSNVRESSTSIEKNILTNGVMEYLVRYSFDIRANPQIKIEGSRYYREASPIWDESDRTIFSQKYIEDDMFSVLVNETTSFTNLRYGTNVFHKKIEFETPFVDDEYCVFFDTYGRGQFVFGYDKSDIQSKTEPTYDAVVSMPMLMNKTESGFDIVLPVHTYFNSIQQYQIGVPWKNEFRLQAIGRYR